VGEERYYPAEIVLQSDFVNGRVRVVVSPADLDEWERCLDALEAEEGAVWPASDRSAWMDIVPDDPFEVTVHPDRSACTGRRRRRLARGEPDTAGTSPNGPLNGP
jgi:hypothetical protein